jgi:hypothetical protein
VTSSAPGALTGLYNALVGASLTGVTIHFGEPLGSLTTDWISVGAQPDTDEVFDATLDWAAFGAGRQEEAYEILCAAKHYSGDEGSPSACMTATFALLDAVRTVIEGNYTLTNAVRVARVSAYSYSQDQDAQGVAGLLLFRVACVQRI